MVQGVGQVECMACSLDVGRSRDVEGTGEHDVRRGVHDVRNLSTQMGTRFGAHAESGIAHIADNGHGAIEGEPGPCCHGCPFRRIAHQHPSTKRGIPKQPSENGEPQIPSRSGNENRLLPRSHSCLQSQRRPMGAVAV